MPIKHPAWSDPAITPRYHPKTAHQNRHVIKEVYCPGLGTGTGRVAPETAAKEMAAAYRKHKEATEGNS